jgi:hypothetical protein
MKTNGNDRGEMRVGGAILRAKRALECGDLAPLFHPRIAFNQRSSFLLAAKLTKPTQNAINNLLFFPVDSYSHHL